MPCISFLELRSCFFSTFHKVFLVPLSTSARNQEKPKKRKIKDFFQVPSFSQKNTSWGSVTFVIKLYRPAPTIPRRKGAFSKNFNNHEPFERRVWPQGLHLRCAFSPYLDQIETHGLDQ